MQKIRFVLPLLVLYGACAGIILTSTSDANAQEGTLLGVGTEFLIGGDLTDPEDDGDPEADLNYNAIFRSNDEPGFGGGENSFNVFDNIVGGGNDKWCCGPGTGIPEDGLWVEAELLSPPVFLSSFTVAAANDTPGRDPTHWAILGSNDGENYDTIFEHDGDSLWGDRLEVVQFIAGTDFDAPDTAYQIFRMATFNTATAPTGAYFQWSELELFGSQGELTIGDFNDDSVVDTADYQILLQTFNTTVERGAGADINFDGSVDFADFFAFREAFTAAQPAGAAAVPEPGSLLLLSLALGGVSLMRRRRS